MPQMLWIFIAILIVLALIGAAAWLVRRFGGGSIGAGGARGRMPRLAVIDAAAVDGRRRLVLVRRDNVEHLLMIGGPTDIVVEPNIVRNTSQRDQAAQRPAGTELHPRAAPLPDADTWSESESARPDIFDFPEPPAPIERPARAPYADDARRHAAPPIAERHRADDFGRLVPTPITRPEVAPRAEPVLHPEPARSESLRHAPRTEPLAPRVTRGPAATIPTQPRPADPLMQNADQNLAEMAQRLEAALRRPSDRSTTNFKRSVAVDPTDRVGAPPVAPEAPRHAETAAPRIEPANDAPHVAAPTSPAATPGQTFDNLEDEMASLLGRPKTPS